MSDAHLNSETDTPGRNAPILKLPNEVLAVILREHLQHSVEQITEWNSYGFIKRPPATTFIQPRSSSEGEGGLQPGLLGVCRRFNEVGTALLYANELIFWALPAWGWDNDKIIEEQRSLIRRLSYEPRDNAHRLKHIQIIIHTPDHWLRRPRPSDGEFMDELCAGLAVHQPCWDSVLFCLIDYSAPNIYGYDRAQCQRLVYGLGRLYAKNQAGGAGIVKKTSADLEWALTQPKHVTPLWVLHKDLVTYLDAYDPDLDTPLPKENSLKSLLTLESETAAEAHDEDAFFLVLEAAVEYIKCVVDNALGGPITAVWRSDKHITRTAAREGQRLLSAKEGKWRGGYTVSFSLPRSRALAQNNPFVTIT